MGKKLNIKKRRRWLPVVLALAVAAVGVRFWLALPKTYGAAEIDEELCLALAPLDNGVSAEGIPLRMVEIRRVDDVILGAYVWENNPRTMGYLRFEPTGSGRYRLAAEFNPGGEPTVLIWERPEAGRYVGLQADGRECYKRYFAVNEVWDDEVGLEFMLDWQDIRVGGSGAMASRVTLLSEPKRRLGAAELSVAAPTRASWLDGRPIADCGGRFDYRQEVAATGAYYTSPGQEVSLPVEFDYQRGGWSFDNYSRHMTRAVNVRYDKKFRLREPGDYLEGIFTYADYVNVPQEPADMQAVWRIDNGCELGTTVKVEILDR